MCFLNLNYSYRANTEKNGFVTATKLGTTNNFLLLKQQILLQQPNVLLVELNILLL